ncbi:molybdopterin-binding protein [Qingshengfaniella alkalisoli]|uniref:Molybdopterin molybdenumtransferase n=1 Tax=Qingshengfaniella alkalisoli TaxID=2599296 RepID=A0A5B8J2U3_9RHOB|nr:molybdopterin-binding protein [Qingshengfaniella alkalisoli]QDY68580.1 molybdopterin molybdenumtransferase MoeA [Qingshengfaniella alkalisoli]
MTSDRLPDDCFALPPGVDWTPVDVALRGLRDRLECVVSVERRPVDQALGCRAAADHHARRANPPTANSAVDGYGFAFDSVRAFPATLPLIQGRSAAGSPLSEAVPAGHAVRILTGAPIPAGVDTVVLQEDVSIEGGTLSLPGSIKCGANTRKAGEDVCVGQVALGASRQITAADIALTTALGIDGLDVYRPLRVGILSTGDELVPAGYLAPDNAEIYDANRPMLLSLARRWSHEAVDLGHVRDDRGALRRCLDEAARSVDVILTTGGASAGDEDHVSSLLREEGTLNHWRIAIKPGRPLALAMWKGAPVFGLPGNPVAAFVCALLFARPSLEVMAGGVWLEPQSFDIPAAFEKRKKVGRQEYLRARVRNGRAEVFPSEGSGRISGLSWAEGLVKLDDGARSIAPGDPVSFIPFGSFGL